MLGRSAYCGVVVEVSNLLLFFFAYTILLLGTD